MGFRWAAQAMELAEDLNEIVLPATLFAPSTTNLLYVGATNGISAHTFASILFPSGLTGLHGVGYMTKLPDGWAGRTVSVYFLGASHATSLPLPQDVRLSIDIYPTEIGGGVSEFDQTLTLNFAQSFTSEQLLGGIKLDENAGGQFTTRILRDYNHPDDDDGLLYFIQLTLRLG